MKKLLLFLSFAWGFSATLQAQTWKQYRSPAPFSSLISENIKSITMDPSGDIWFGTWGGGLSQFSGTTWQTYTTTNAPFLVNDIMEVVIDKNGDPWIATYGGGIHHMGTTITNYNINTNGAFLSDLIFSACKDLQDNLWFGTDGGGVLKWNGTEFTTYYKNNSSLQSNIIRKVLTAKDGNLWLGTWGGGLTKFDGTSWVTYSTANSAIKSDFIYDMAEDSAGNIWMATETAGLCKFNLNTKSVEAFSNNDISSTIQSIAIDSLDNKWVGSVLKGLFKFSGGTWTTYTVANSGLVDNTINKIVFDKEGSMWLGTTKGICVFDNTAWTVYNVENTRVNGPASDNLVKNYVDRKGNIWLLSNPASVSKFDGTTWTNYNPSNSALPAGPYTCITEDIGGNIWVGSANQGAIKFNGTTWTRYFTGNSPIAENFISSIACDKTGNIWFGSLTKGLTKFDGTRWTNYAPFSYGLNTKYIQHLLADNENNLWIGTADNGLIKFNGTTWTSFNPTNSNISSTAIYDLAMDNSGNIWIGTSNGLDRFDGQAWVNYSISNSALIAHSISSLQTDRDGNIWIGTDGGISVFNGTKWATYLAGNNALNSNKVSSISIDAQNNKWVATRDGGLNELLDGDIAFRMQQNWHVRPNAAGSGASWTDATGSLDWAIQNAGAGDSIFVAAGTYQPKTDTVFSMKPGVKIFGGFKGNETAFTQRDLKAGFNSILKGNGSAVIANVNNGLTRSAVLDGFTLTGGTGFRSAEILRGGAMFNYYVSPTIAHCIFSKNNAQSGGAVYNVGGTIYFLDCRFLDNKLTDVYNGGAATEERANSVYVNCIFTDNQSGNSTGASGAGGALALNSGYASFYNCLFTYNKALGASDGGGGAIFISNSTATINNCTFYGNTTTARLQQGSGQQVLGNTLSFDTYGATGSEVSMMNTIIYGLQAEHIYAVGPSVIHLERSVVKGYEVDNNMDGVIDEKDVVDNLPYNTDPLFMDAAAKDFRLKPTSPCISAGSLANYYATDLSGNPRIVDNKIDLGAYQSPGLEFHATPGQKLTSNRADTAAGGTIYLYNNTENAVIVGVNPNGQDLGNIEATGSLSTQYGSGEPTTLESPFGITGEIYCLNRSWHVTLTKPDFNAPVTVRFFIDTTDLQDLMVQMPKNTKVPHNLEEWMAFAPLIQVYKVDGDNAYAPGATNYKQYTFSENNQTADLSHFIIGQYQKLFYLEFMVSEFSSGSVAYIPLATPIQLLTFEGTLKNGQANFNWQTGEELNFKQFDLEKSADNNTYIRMATITPKGNNSSYQKAVQQLEASAYYRLRLTDLNGKSDYSHTIKLVQEKKNFSIYPNPAADYIKIYSQEAAILYIYDGTGKQVMTGHLTKGENRIRIAHLAAGLYYIRCKNQQAQFIKK